MDQADIRRRFRELYRVHMLRGEVHPLEQYQALFSGHEELVAEEFSRMTRRVVEESVFVSSLIGAANGDDDGVVRTLGRLVPDPRERFRDRVQIGHGAMGSVLRVFDDSLERSLAMKVIRDDLSAFKTDESRIRRGPQLVRRFVEEARITAQLDHPGVVPVHDFGLDADGQLFFTMKLVDGRVLDQVFGLVHASAESWSLTRVVQIFIRICETLAFAHSRGVIHRDIKPANVMIGSYGEVYVMDWGLAKRMRDRSEASNPMAPVEEAPASRNSLNATRAGAVMGSPPYMAPEQAKGQQYDIGPHTDVYAVGAMLYQLLSSHAPYTQPGGATTSKQVIAAVRKGPATPLSELCPEAPDELIAITEKAMARRVAYRYPTAKDLADDLQNYVEGRVVRAYRTGAGTKFKKWIARNRAVALAGLAAILIGIAGAIAYMVQDVRRVEVAEQATQAADRAARLARDAAKQEKEAAGRERAAREHSEGLRLAAVAHTLVDESPTRALLLAIEASERAPGPEALTALYSAVANLYETRMLLGHDQPLVDAVFSPDGKRIATIAREPFVLLWDAANGDALHRLHCNGKAVAAAAFSPDGGRLASITPAGLCQLWDTTTGDPIASRALESGRPVEIAFAHEGRTIEVYTAQGEVLLVDGHTLAGTPRFSGHAGGRRNLLWTADRTRILSVGAEGQVRTIDVASGARRALIEPPVAGPPDGRRTWLSRDGARAITAGHDCVAWSLAKRDVAWSRDGVQVLAVSADLDRVLVGVEDGIQVELLDGATGDRIALCVRPEGVTHYRFGPRGERILAHGRHENSLSFWDPRTPSDFVPLRGHTYHLANARFSPDGGRIVSAADDSTARIWTLDFPGDRLGLAQVPNARALAVAPDGNTAVLELPARGVRAFPRIVVHATAQGSSLFDLGDGETAPRTAADIRFTAGGSHLVALCRDGAVRVWELRSAEMLRTIEHGVRGGNLLGIEPSADGDRVLIHQQGGPFEVYDVSTGGLVHEFEPGEAAYSSVALSPDGNRVAIVAGDQARVSVHDLAGGRVVCTMVGHTGHVSEAAFSTDGTRLATTAVDSSVRLWDAQTGALIRVTQGFPMEPMRLDFSPRGDLLAVISSEGVHLLDARQGTPRAKIHGRFPRARFSPDGNFLVSLQERGLVRRWPVDVERFARSQKPRDLSPAERVLFGFGETVDLLPNWRSWAERNPSVRNHHQWVSACLDAGDFDQAEEAARKIVRLRPEHPFGPLDLARVEGARSVAEHPHTNLDQGIERLRQAIELGLRDRIRREHDPHLAGLAGHADFPALLERIPLGR